MNNKNKVNVTELFDTKKENAEIALGKAKDVLLIATSIASQVFNISSSVTYSIEDFYHPPVYFGYGDGEISKTEPSLTPNLNAGNYGIIISYRTRLNEEIRVKILIEPHAGAIFDIIFNDKKYEINVLHVTSEADLNLLTSDMADDIYNYILQKAKALFYKDDEWIVMSE